MNFYGPKELILGQKKAQENSFQPFLRAKIDSRSLFKQTFLEFQNLLKISFFKKSHIFTLFLRFGENEASYDHETNCNEFLWI